MTTEMLEKKLHRVRKPEGPFFNDLVQRLFPRPILDGKMHKFYLEVITALLEALERGEFKGEEKTAIENYVEAVSHFVEEYEKERFPLARSSASEILRFLMEQSHATQEKMAEILGTSQPVVSELLKGKRKITTDHIERLSQHFKISPALFFAPAA